MHIHTLLANEEEEEDHALFYPKETLLFVRLIFMQKTQRWKERNNTLR